jgi:hypothetical protein
MMEGVECLARRDFQLELLLRAAIDDADEHAIGVFEPEKRHREAVAFTMVQLARRVTPFRQIDHARLSYRRLLLDAIVAPN